VEKNQDGEVVGTNKVTLQFDRSFTVLSSGAGYDNISSLFQKGLGNTLVGGGGQGVIQFDADEKKPFSIEWEVISSEEDPDEVRDLGESVDHAQVREEMRTKLFDRLASRRNRVTVTDAAVEARTNGARSHGVIIGEW
jgi:hypothetical protein